MSSATLSAVNTSHIGSNSTLIFRFMELEKIATQTYDWSGIIELSVKVITGLMSNPTFNMDYIIQASKDLPSDLPIGSWLANICAARENFWI